MLIHFVSRMYIVYKKNGILFTMIHVNHNYYCTCIKKSRFQIDSYSQASSDRGKVPTPEYTYAVLGTTR